MDTTVAYIDGGDEAAEEAVSHLVADLRESHRLLLEAALGNAVLRDGLSRASIIQRGSNLAGGLYTAFDGMVAGSTASQGASDGKEQRSDLSMGERAGTATEAVSEALEDDGWTEDRR